MQERCKICFLQNVSFLGSLIQYVRKIFRRTNISYTVITGYHGVRIASFSEMFRSLCVALLLRIHENLCKLNDYHSCQTTYCDRLERDVIFQKTEKEKVTEELKNLRKYVVLLGLYKIIQIIRIFRLLQKTLTYSFPMHPFSTPRKHKKTISFSYFFRGQRTGALGTNGLTSR